MRWGMQDAGFLCDLATIQKHLSKGIVVKYPEHNNYLK
jgi:hypothetical protein